MGDDLHIRAAHRLRRFNDAEADFLDGAFDHARHIGGGGDDEHHDDSAVAEAGADDELCDRQHCDHEDDERDAAEEVHDEAEDAVDPRGRADAVGVRDGEDHAEGKADHVGDRRGDKSHVYGFPYAELDKAVVPKLIKHFGKHYSSSFHVTGLFLSQTRILSA